MRRLMSVALCLVVARAALAQGQPTLIPLKWVAPRVVAAMLGGGGKLTEDQIHQARQAWVNDMAGRVANIVTRRRGGNDPQWYYASTIDPSPTEQISPNGNTWAQLLPPGLDGPPVAYMPQNAILARGTPAAIDQLRELIALIDVKPQQVNVEVKLEDQPRTRTNEWGMDLSVQGGGLFLASAGNAPGGGLQTTYRRGNLQGTMGANQGDSRGHTVTAANLTTTNNFPAIITFGRMLPVYNTQVSYDNFGNRTVQSTWDAVFIGTELFVQPRINRDNTVTMLLQPTFIEAVGTIAGPNGTSMPITETLQTSTQVTVPDGETLQIGGFERSAQTLNTQFRGLLSVRNTSVQSHPSLFVTPRILRDLPADQTGRE